MKAFFFHFALLEKEWKLFIFTFHFSNFKNPLSLVPELIVGRFNHPDVHPELMHSNEIDSWFSPNIYLRNFLQHFNADYNILFFAGGIISRTGCRACTGARSLLQMDKKVSPEAERNID